MARPAKKRLDYFPLDVDIFEDDKLFDVQIQYGPLGEIIYMRLLCLVYKNGYYYRFTSLDKLAALMIKSIGGKWARDKNTVKEVILYLAKINLFSAELMHENVITSRSIQRRYLKATERRRSEIHEYSLLEKNDFQEGLISAPKSDISVAENRVIAAETPVYVNNNPTNKSKENKSKVKESKVKERECADGRTSQLGAGAPSPALQRTDSKPIKREYGTYKNVLLTDEEYEKLQQEFAYDYSSRIERLSEYMASAGKKYDNHLATIRVWAKQDEAKHGGYAAGGTHDVMQHKSSFTDEDLVGLAMFND